MRGGLGDPRRVEHRAERDLEEPGQVRRAVLVGERDGLLGRERVAAVAGSYVDVAAGGLGVEPLAHVALGGAGARGELGGRQRPGAGERAIEAEPVAHHDERGVQRRADLVDGAEHELLELRRIQRRGFGGGHGSPFGDGFSGRAMMGTASPCHIGPRPYLVPSRAPSSAAARAPSRVSSDA